MTDRDPADEVEALRQELGEVTAERDQWRTSSDDWREIAEQARAEQDEWRAKYTKLAVHVLGMADAHRRALAALETPVTP